MREGAQEEINYSSRQPYPNREDDVKMSPSQKAATGTGSNHGIHFGVVGEGRSKRILAYASMSSESLSFLEENWKCDKCTFENTDGMNPICEMCGSETQRNLSAIDENTAFNLAKEASQKRLNELRAQPGPPPRRISEAERRGSISVETLIEGMVESNRLDPVASFADLTIQERGGWTCPDCTFVNRHPDHLTCEVCGQQKPALEDYKYGSARDFLSESMRQFVDSSNDSFSNQTEACLNLERQASGKERMASLVAKQKELLQAATSNNSNVAAFIDKDRLRRDLEDGGETLKFLENGYFEEKEEYDAMVRLQEVKAREIEASEGVTPQEANSPRAARPGVHRVSRQSLEWLGQQRMLDDWKLQLEESEMEIKLLKDQQEEVLAQLMS